MISINVGNVVKSVGFGIYRDISIIKTEIERDIVSKKSSTALGRGTIIIAKIAIIKKTIVKSFDFTIGSRNGATFVSKLFLAFANKKPLLL